MDILKDAEMEGKITEKRILITGASAGIGVETIRVLALTGATILTAARDLEKDKRALVDVEGKIELLKLDLASQSSVRAAAGSLLQ
jgi:NAD(P)-dependent dehydrogenase (short-subunit alcohol dehydrogenase family)